MTSLWEREEVVNAHFHGLSTGSPSQYFMSFDIPNIYPFSFAYPADVGLIVPNFVFAHFQPKFPPNLIISMLLIYQNIIYRFVRKHFTYLYLLIHNNYFHILN